jgi:hypothetical protein
MSGGSVNVSIEFDTDVSSGMVIRSVFLLGFHIPYREESFLFEGQGLSIRQSVTQFSRERRTSILEHFLAI